MYDRQETNKKNYITIYWLLQILDSYGCFDWHLSYLIEPPPKNVFTCSSDTERWAAPQPHYGALDV